MHTSPSCLDAAKLVSRVLQVSGSFQNVPAGQWALQLLVAGAGYALMPANAQHISTLQATSISPATGGLFGGLTVQVQGSGIDGTNSWRSRWGV